ncbi:MAG TPA: hypothetical protein VN238_07950, partial [Solirubrobacteraceae bacterium]|nr:hypothetical protein [Solirubrobacteraceae bacterium]
PVGDRPNGVAVARGWAYVTIPRSDRLVRVRTDRFAKAERGPRVGRGALDVDAGFGALWVPSASRAERLARVDLTTGETTYTDLPDGTPVAVEAGEGAVWVGVRGAKLRSYPPSLVLRIDPKTGKILKRVRIPLGIQDIAVGDGAVWATNRARDSLTRLDIRTGEFVELDVGGGPAGVAVGGGRVWVANAEDDTISRVSRSELRSTGTIALDGQPRFLAFGAGSLWATTYTTSTLVRIDPKNPLESTGEPTQLGFNPTKLLVSGNAVYAVSQADGVLERVPIG